VYRFRKKSS